jgi:hypothetical protein
VMHGLEWREEIDPNSKKKTLLRRKCNHSPCWNQQTRKKLFQN